MSSVSGCTGVGFCPNGLEDRLQEIAGGRRCQNPTRSGSGAIVTVIVSLVIIVVASACNLGRLHLGDARPRARSPSANGPSLRNPDPSRLPSAERDTYLVLLVVRAPFAPCWCLRFASATMTLRDSSRHQPGQYSWPRSHVRQIDRSFLQQAHVKSRRIEHDLERADFLPWLIFGKRSRRRDSHDKEGRELPLPAFVLPGVPSRNPHQRVTVGFRRLISPAADHPDRGRSHLLGRGRLASMSSGFRSECKISEGPRGNGAIE